MTLTDFDFGEGASCDIAAIDLKSCRELFLSYTGIFSKVFYIISYRFFNTFVHIAQKLPWKFCT